jgi:hypothetical protein
MISTYVFMLSLYNFGIAVMFIQLYKGRVKDGSMVMVNIVKLKQKSLSKISDENLKVLPCLRHRHLVSVLGHCAITYKDNPNMTSTIFIVFEHISTMSSLRIHLTGNKHSHKNPLIFICCQCKTL